LHEVMSHVILLRCTRSRLNFGETSIVHSNIVSMLEHSQEGIGITKSKTYEVLKFYFTIVNPIQR
jgi:hypothetical protein